ncbi:helix-turn-helix transcriptional regulator [Rhizobium sp. P40RR-XXII]|uniref:XRE family transcriptional regulator n=1 Tax=Rhizobium sp. P40RR-XXII TaxID=2726739 RepID=UPI001456FE6B|nr:helix-turn-helix transcriptional regulator [Rhizobium sp. P40RR-XXII]NLS19868.1 helix-turn-helix transcriptional regulator [Rhizobium sp. P40RR-XXII]
MSTIKELREKKGLSQQQLADLAGTSQPQIKRLETGERKLTKEWAERLAPHLDTIAPSLMFEMPSAAASQPESGSVHPLELPNAEIRGKVEGVGRKIPVYGQAVGGLDGEFIMNGSILYEVMAPPILSHISGAYAVQVSGDSMYPRYEDGEVCFVDPKRRVKKGDYVIAQIRLEEHGPLLAYVKKFVRHNAAELVLEQFNPVKELRFVAGTVESVHYIALAGAA